MDEDGSDDDADDVDCVDILLVTVGPSSFWSVIVDSLTVIYCFVDARFDVLVFVGDTTALITDMVEDDSLNH